MSLRSYFIFYLYTISLLKHAAHCLFLAEYKAPSAVELSFMKRFGYLPADDSDSGDADYTYTAQSVSQAVSKLQHFAGIPVTGVLDDKTKEIFHKRRCGLPDIEEHSRKRRYVVAKKGWQKNLISFKVLNGSTTMRKTRVEDLMEKAFQVWAPYGNLQFMKLDDAKADIEVMFTVGDHGDGNAFDGPGNIVAHAFPPPHGGMHFDDDEVWGESETGLDDEEVTDLYAVAVHEIGHALGLGHSSVRSSIMYPYYQVPVSGLNADDINAMHELYLQFPPPSSMTKFERKDTMSPKSTVATAPEHQPPDLCSTEYNLIAVIKQQIFVFKDEWLWIFHERKLSNKHSPTLMTKLFKDLPTNYAIDAVYERKDGNIAVFSGQQYCLFNQNYQLINTGSISDYSLPNTVHNVRAAFRSNYNNKTYFFQENEFYRFDEDTWTIDVGYPRTMQAWRNIPAGINSAIVWKGDTYLFKGPRFWRFDNNRIIAHQNYPVPTAQLWFGCPETPDMVQYMSYP